jgi:hypothetical protein
MKILILALFVSNLAYSVGISLGDQPSKILKNYSNLFISLPLAGNIQDKTLGWPGGHWQSNLGSISHRWSSNDPEIFTYSYRSLEELKTTPQYLIDAMSPAEKLSIYQRDYNYKLVDKIRSQYSVDENDWHGICHGVAAAQMNHGEPQKKIVTNRDGIKIEFYSSDLKGLISYYYANISNAKAVQTGLRCHSSDSRNIDCQGINPATFHLVLANKIGLDRKPFIADIDRGLEVWNQVAIAFNSYIVDEYPVNANADPRAVKMIRVQTEVTFESSIQPTFGPVIGTDLAEYLHNNYDYYLEIDNYGDVIGGQWISDLRPDFLFLRDKAKFNGDWADLLNLYNPIRP